MITFQNFSFLKSVVSIRYLPQQGTEVAFIGRSNVGKSSLLNAITQKPLAKTSNTPGRTQMINYFHSHNRYFLVDLPGYGYTNAPKNIAEKWLRLSINYFRTSHFLKRVYILIDARHGVKEIDLDMMEEFNIMGLSYQIILTKIDKISTQESQDQLKYATELTQKHPACFPHVFLVSSEKRTGMEELRQNISDVLLQEAL
jgi:GTP-binding protein